MNHRARRLLATCALLLVVLAIVALPRGARADGDPNLDWYTIETTHYHLHFDKHLEPIARRIATLVEGIHDRQGQALGYVPKDYTEIVITDDTDDANGSATAIPFNTIRLFVTAPDDLSVLGDYDDWYLELVTHEYTHIVHTDNISGLPAIVNAVIGKSYAPNQIQPRWILEGLAVVEESEHTSAGRIRSNLFDMWLRADVLDDRIAGIDQFSSNAYRWPGGNIWYLYGSRFLRWIVDVYGANTMRAVAADYGATTIPWGINRAIRRVTGRTYVELYDGFKDHIKRQYEDQIAGVHRRGLREGRRLTFHGRNVFYPRFVPKVARKGSAEEIVYFRDDFNTRGGIYRFALGPREADDEELVARADANAVSAFTPKGDLVFNDISYFRNIYLRNDLFFLPKGEKAPHGDEAFRKKLTTGIRATSADVSPDGKKVAFTINTKGTSYLQIADLTPENTVENRRDLVRSGRFDQAFTPRFSPDGKTVAYSAWTAGGFRDIRLVDVATGRFTEVAHDRAIDMTPIWSSDGKVLYFSSDRSGIFNIYAWDLAEQKLYQVTNVRIGALQPAVSDDDKTLVYVGYTTYGYDLFTMANDRSRWLPAVTAVDDRPDPPREPAYVPMKVSKYNPLPTLRPHNWLFSLKPGIYGSEAVNLTVDTSDVVGLHNVSASLTVEPKQPSPTFSLDYSYDRLPVNLSVHAFHQTNPRSGYKVNDKDVPYNETTNGLSTGVSYTKREDYGSHSFGLSYSVANFFGDLPVGAGLDPNSASIPTKSVPRGNINVMHVGYGFSNVESGADQPGGSARGFYLDVGVDWAGDYTGSSYTVHALSGDFGFYLTMPWWHHVLAWRTAGAAQGGNYARNGAYYVGGYDLANNNVFSSVQSGVFNGSFVLRGYPPGVYYGNEYLLQNVEYRFPIWFVDHGIASLPLYLRRIDGNLFFDYGGAFDDLHFRNIRLFSNGAIIDSPFLHASVGGEIWLGSTLGYAINTNFRVGYARGFSEEAVKGGQWYFIASSAF